MRAQTALTRRERELVELICAEGFATKEAAHRLGLTTGTAKGYLDRAYKKLNVHSDRELIVQYWRGRLAGQRKAASAALCGVSEN